MFRPSLGHPQAHLFTTEEISLQLTYHGEKTTSKEFKIRENKTKN